MPIKDEMSTKEKTHILLSYLAGLALISVIANGLSNVLLNAVKYNANMTI